MDSSVCKKSVMILNGTNIEPKMYDIDPNIVFIDNTGEIWMNYTKITKNEEAQLACSNQLLP